MSTFQLVFNINKFSSYFTTGKMTKQDNKQRKSEQKDDKWDSEDLATVRFSFFFYLYS